MSGRVRPDRLLQTQAQDSLRDLTELVGEWSLDVEVAILKAQINAMRTLLFSKNLASQEDWLLEYNRALRAEIGDRERGDTRA